MKVDFNFDSASFETEKGYLTATIRRLNLFLAECKSHGITVDQSTLINLIENNHIVVERFQKLVDDQTLTANPQLVALKVSIDKMKMLIDFPDVEEWENVRIQNGSWLTANPSSYSIENNIATMLQGWQETLKKRFTLYATSEIEQARLAIIREIKPLFEKFASLAEVPDSFDWQSSPFYLDEMGGVQINEYFVTLGYTPMRFR